MDTYAPPNDPLDIVHEDTHLFVVNKPSGLLSVPGKGCLLYTSDAADD